jgi:hypothetical protein
VVEAGDKLHDRLQNIDVHWNLPREPVAAVWFGRRSTLQAEQGAGLRML